MNFSWALAQMKQGQKVKLPAWAGYWAWENGTIMMHTKDGDIIDIRDTDKPEYTFSNLASEEWMIAEPENTALLGGRMQLSFGDALNYVIKRRLGMRLPHWKEDVIVRAYFPDKNSMMTAPYLYVESRFGKVPWKETMIELFSEDWQIVD